jgi:hypothetical protein
VALQKEVDEEKNVLVILEKKLHSHQLQRMKASEVYPVEVD